MLAYWLDQGDRLAARARDLGAALKDLRPTLRAAYRCNEAVWLILVRLPADVVIKGAAHPLGKRLVDLGAHGQALLVMLDLLIGSLPVRGGGDVQPGQKGLKLREQLVGKLQNNNAGLLGNHRVLLAAARRRPIAGDDRQRPLPRGEGEGRSTRRACARS